ncbi:MAG: carboxypeptidase regulatory-like domain-containing protein [Candidatus Cloacimonetes bacterium]|nr:carboxypeptidase regulatory-like domain-containing protein [Candidatus Cloacimonadota bacterium]
MLNLKFYFLIMLVLFSVFCFSDQIDPAMGNKTGYHSSQVTLESAYIRAYSSRDTIPPSFTITHIENGDVTIQVTSDEDIFIGWVDEKLVWSAVNFDYWWLNTRLGKDAQNKVYAGIKLYEYSTPNSNFDMYELYNNGNIIQENLDWNGPGGNPLIVNNPEENVYLGQPTLDPEGVVDSDNITYIASNAGGSNVLFTKIDADGTILVNNQTVITGANAWTNEIRIAIDTNHRIYLVWSADMHDITYAYSDDGGDSWSTPASLCYNASQQLNKPQVCCDSYNNVHIIWQHWTGSSNLLSYMKLRSDGTIAIDESFLTQANNQVWSARMDIDEENNLHIVWAKSSQQITDAYYTKINGNLDGNGLPITDEELTLVPEHPFLNSQNIRYPKCVVDNYHNAHSIYEQGNYGCNENKSVYYKKMNSAPLLRIVCPNDSVLFVEMTGSGTNWEGVFTPPELGIYNVRVSASDIDGNTGVDFYQFEYPSINDGYISGNVVLSGGVGAVENVQVMAGIYSTNPDANGDYVITLPPGTYDVTASLEYYEPDMVTGVVVEEGITTSGVDLTLVFAPPLNPPQNFAVDPYTGLATWDPPVPVPGLELLEYNVFLNGDMFTTTETQWQFENLIYGIIYTAGIQAVYDLGESEIVELEFIYLGTGAEDMILSSKTELIGNYPNPFNPMTTIKFTTENTEKNTEIIIYNLKGQKIKQLVSNQLSAGQHSVVWNGTDENNQPVGSGIYFYQLKAGNQYSETKRMLLLK